MRTWLLQPLAMLKHLVLEPKCNEHLHFEILCHTTTHVPCFVVATQNHLMPTLVKEVSRDANLPPAATSRNDDGFRRGAAAGGRFGTVGSLPQKQAWVTIPWVEHLATGTGTATRHSAPDNKVTAPVRQLSRTEDSITLKTTTVITPRPWQSV